MEEGGSNGGMLYHEVQEAKLCALHCVNAVLQGPFFSELDLAALASDLDRQERRVMLGAAEAGEDSIPFGSTPVSHNVSLDGDFSIQVLEKALEVWDLQVISFDSPIAEPAKLNPGDENAFICHLHNHWFCIRKINGEWYNFNSLYAAPEHLSRFYLSAYLDTLTSSGWSIFVVRGNFPKECPISGSESANSFGHWISPEDAQRITKSQHTTSALLDNSDFSDAPPTLDAISLAELEEKDLNEAIAASLRDSFDVPGGLINQDSNK